MRGEPFFLSFFRTFQAEGRHLGDDSCSVWNVALVALVSNEWLIGEGHNPNLSVLLELRKSFQHKLSPLEQSSVKAIARGLRVVFLGELSLGEQEAAPCCWVQRALPGGGAGLCFHFSFFSWKSCLLNMDNCHLQWRPPYRLAQTPSLGALQTQLRVRVSCRAGADATPRLPCGAHLLAPASGGLCWHSGQSGLAVANQGGLKVCSLNRNKISIGHFTGKTSTSALQHSCKGSREIILLMTLSASPQKPSSVGSKYRGLTTQEPDSLGCGPGLLGRGTFCPALGCQ